MIGNTNIILQQFATLRYGEDVWSEIMWSAGMKKDAPLKGQAYPDALTYDLIQHLSMAIAQPLRDLLMELGKFQVKEILHKKYGSIRVFPDGHLLSILRHLPTFHTTLTLLTPHLRMPTYLVRPKGENNVEILYKGDHILDAPYVEGLLRGIIDLYNYGLTAEVAHTYKRTTTDEFDIFNIHW
jgi:hypothetical protein